MGINRDALAKPVLLVLDAMAAPTGRCGKDRVCLVFDFLS
jgi:hypothetical protein